MVCGIVNILIEGCWSWKCKTERKTEDLCMYRHVHDKDMGLVNVRVDNAEDMVRWTELICYGNSWKKNGTFTVTILAYINFWIGTVTVDKNIQVFPKEKNISQGYTNLCWCGQDQAGCLYHFTLRDGSLLGFFSKGKCPPYFGVLFYACFNFKRVHCNDNLVTTKRAI